MTIEEAVVEARRLLEFKRTHPSSRECAKVCLAIETLLAEVERLRDAETSRRVKLRMDAERGAFIGSYAKAVMHIRFGMNTN